MKITGPDWDTDVELAYYDDEYLTINSDELPEDFGGSLDLFRVTSSSIGYGTANEVENTWNITLLAFEHNGQLLYPAE